MPLITRARLVFECLVLVAFAYAAWQTRAFPELAAQFPRAICIAGLLMATLAIVVDLYQLRTGGNALPAELLDAASRFAEVESREETVRLLQQTLRYALWIAGLLLGIWLLTFPGAVAVFLTAFLVLEGHVRLRNAGLAGVAVAVALMAIVNVMNMVVPASIWASL